MEKKTYQYIQEAYINVYMKKKKKFFLKICMKREGYNTKIMSGGLATWPSTTLPFRFFFFYLPYQPPGALLFSWTARALSGENKLKIGLKWQKTDVYTRWSLCASSKDGMHSPQSPG